MSVDCAANRRDSSRSSTKIALPDKRTLPLVPSNYVPNTRTIKDKPQRLTASASAPIHTVCSVEQSLTHNSYFLRFRRRVYPRKVNEGELYVPFAHLAESIFFPPENARVHPPLVAHRTYLQETLVDASEITPPFSSTFVTDKTYTVPALSSVTAA